MFKTVLKVKLIDNEDGTWEVLEDLVYEDSELGIIKVPAGFKTDFASVPRIPVVFDIVGYCGTAAATLHDYLYATSYAPRETCDRILLDALRSTDVGKARSYAMYYGVRAFGASHYGTK